MQINKKCLEQMLLMINSQCKSNYSIDSDYIINQMIKSGFDKETAINTFGLLRKENYIRCSQPYMDGSRAIDGLTASGEAFIESI